MTRMTHLLAACGAMALASLAAAVPEITWDTIDAGGATSTGLAGAATLSVSGTIGQFDVGQTMTGVSDNRTITLVGGYWADARCPADFNADQSVDFFDYLDFVAAFAAEEAGADINNDGTVDFFDYLDFAQSFDAGC